MRAGWHATCMLARNGPLAGRHAMVTCLRRMARDGAMVAYRVRATNREHGGATRRDRIGPAGMPCGATGTGRRTSPSHRAVPGGMGDATRTTGDLSRLAGNDVPSFRGTTILSCRNVKIICPGLLTLGLGGRMFALRPDGPAGWRTKMPMIEIPDDFAVTVHGHTLDVAYIGDMSAVAVAYLIRNGFSQSITDAAALDTAKRAKLGLDTETKLAAWAAEKRHYRFDAIIAGTVGSNGPTGPRLRGIDSVAFDVAVEAIRLSAAFTSGKVAWPTGKGAAEMIRGWVDQYFARPGKKDATYVEAQRRMDSTSADDDFVPTAA